MIQETYESILPSGYFPLDSLKFSYETRSDQEGFRVPFLSLNYGVKTEIKALLLHFTTKSTIFRVSKWRVSTKLRLRLEAKPSS